MKLLICSDVHGSSYYMEKVISAFNEKKCDKIVILGDLLYHGPRNDLPHGHHPKGVIKLVNEYKEKIIMVKGNCEAEVDQMVLEFPINELVYMNVCDRDCYFTHGHKYGPSNPLPACKGSLVFYGHTHVTKHEDIDGVSYINPGSTSLPKQNTKNGFIVFDGQNIEFYDIEMELIDKIIL